MCFAQSNDLKILYFVAYLRIHAARKAAGLNRNKTETNRRPNMKHFIALSSLFLLSACAGTQQLVAVQPDGSKIVENSFYQQTAFGTDSRMNVISVCDPRCSLVSLSGRYSSGYGRAVTTQLVGSVSV